MYTIESDESTSAAIHNANVVVNLSELVSAIIFDKKPTDICMIVVLTPEAHSPVSYINCKDISHALNLASKLLLPNSINEEPLLGNYLDGVKILDFEHMKTVCKLLYSIGVECNVNFLDEGETIASIFTRFADDFIQSVNGDIYELDNIEVHDLTLTKINIVEYQININTEDDENYYESPHHVITACRITDCINILLRSMYGDPVAYSELYNSNYDLADEDQKLLLASRLSCAFGTKLVKIFLLETNNKDTYYFE